MLNVNSISHAASTSGQDTGFSEQSDSSENQIESVTVSRTPPWRKNSILNQQSKMTVVGQSFEHTNISNANSRVPPLPQQHSVQNQPPWQEETQKRRNNPNKRPNFKEDPTGYLNQQTAILHSSILNVHSPDLHDQESSNSTSQHSYRQSPRHTNQSTSHSSADTINLLNNETVCEDHDQQQQQQMSVMQQQQQNQNQNVYIQQFDSNGISKNQVIIGSNGQPMRIVQNAAPVIYTNAGEFALNSVQVPPQITQPIAKPPEFVSGKRAQHNLLNSSQTVQIHRKSDDHATLIPIMSQPQSQPFSSLGRSPKLLQTQRTIVVSQSDQETGGLNKEENENLGLPIDVTHLPNGVVQVHHNCDMNQVKSQTQTMLVKSNPTTMRNIQSKSNDHQYIMPPQRQGILTRVVSVPQESPVSSSTANKTSIIEIQSAINDRGPSQVETISTSNESPPISSPDTSASPESSITINDSHVHLANKSQTSVYISGQTSGKNTITSVLAGKAMTSTTTTNQFALINDKNRPNESLSHGNFIQIHENRILKPAQAVQMAKHVNNIAVSVNAGVSIKPSNNRAIQSIVQESQSSMSTQSNLPNIQIQQPTNQIIMTSSGCQILVMPTQNSKNSNQMIIGQSSNGNTLVMNNASGQQNVVFNPQNAHMIHGNEIIQGINDSTIGGAAPNIMQNNGNNVVIQSPNLIQSPNNVITTNNTNSNYIVSSPNAIQPMLINNSNLLSHNSSVLHHPNQNVIQGNANNILATANATKVISNAGNLLSSPNILTNQANVIAANNQFIGSNNSGALLSPNNSGIVLNQLPNTSYVIQPQPFTTVDGQMVNVINSDNGSQFVQQTQQRIILSPDSKRRVKKRKSSSVSPQSESPQQSPTIQTPSQQPTVLQITPQYHHHQPQQSFQTTIEVSSIARFYC